MAELNPPSSERRTGSGDAPPWRYTARLAGEIETRWQAEWESRGTFRTPNPGDAGFDGSRPKFYCLDMFPYPSGAGLHVGHPEGYTATDIISRLRRMKGYNVLHPMGWDAFGLPAEQYAIQTGVHPAITTRRAIDTFRGQLKRFGFSYDWSREFATIDESYYRWTQWIFLQIYGAWFDHAEGRARPIAELERALESGAYGVGPDGGLVPMTGAATPGVERERRGARAWKDLGPAERRRVIDGQRLAYVGEQVVNWCPKLGTALANEEVIDGKSERGGYPVFRKPLRQWLFRITAYAERLLRGLEGLDWPASTRTMQAEWIGRSEGAEIRFETDGPGRAALTVYTTRPDTLFGATYMVVAPEHPLCDAVIAGRAGVAEETRRAVEAYCAAARNRSDVERQESKAKTGVFTGVTAVNPATGEKIPVWAADYVLMGYGHGAIMAVPAHDERDFEFARTFGLPIRDVVYSRTESAMAYFASAATVDDRSEVRWQGILADLLGYTTTNTTDPVDYGEALHTVRSRRTRGGDGTAVPVDYAGPRTTVPGAVGFKRGSVSTSWLDAIGSMGFGTFAEFRDVFEAREYHARRGEAYAGPGLAVNSSNAEVSLDGLSRGAATEAIIAWLERTGIGRRRVNYKLRDWLFSRQRYWGEPFPIVYDRDGDHHPLSEASLPLVLPELKEYQPEESEDPRPLLAKAKDWVRTTAGAAGVPGLDPAAPVTRETNTMPGWAGSCWYFLRYCDAGNSSAMCGREAERYWMGEAGKDNAGVDLYIGGSEHAVLHLLYARFWHKVLFDLGHVSTDEPFRRLFHQGLITSYAFQRADKSLVPTDQVEERGEGVHVEKATGQRVAQIVAKMSKSLKNVVNPDDVIAEFGADTFRLYEMYMGPLEASKPWNPRDIVGCHRFLQKVWRLCIDELSGRVRTVDAADPAVERLLHRTIAKVEGDVERLAFNTAIAAMIEFVNAAGAGGLTPDQAARFALTLCPFAPHLAEELWSRLGKPGLASVTAWPGYDEAMLRDESVEMPVQIQGKVRARITVPAGADVKSVESAALADAEVQKHVAGRPIKRVIVVPGKLVNVVTG